MKQCSIDSLLDQTIKHMLFLRSVTNRAEKLKQCVYTDQGTELGYREVFLVSIALATLTLAAVLSNLDMEMDPRLLARSRPLGVSSSISAIMLALTMVFLSENDFYDEAKYTHLESNGIHLLSYCSKIHSLENEHLNNVGKYRAFKFVPLPFNYDENEDKDESCLVLIYTHAILVHLASSPMELETLMPVLLWVLENSLRYVRDFFVAY
ncbi:hypothetical protein IFM89_002507 [Coptis chinensis]|uniref:BHLH domain-containing protein n=1 Tax=Coptis chinensis TaxID=261450 RepID=A0A835HKJ7_9MAGN|nr:hypothetical protein IFM89_002507 [Coptis chinensis]